MGGSNAAAAVVSAVQRVLRTRPGSRHCHRSCSIIPPRARINGRRGMQRMSSGPCCHLRRGRRAEAGAAVTSPQSAPPTHAPANFSHCVLVAVCIVLLFLPLLPPHLPWPGPPARLPLQPGPCASQRLRRRHIMTACHACSAALFWRACPHPTPTLWCSHSAQAFHLYVVFVPD